MAVPGGGVDLFGDAVVAVVGLGPLFDLLKEADAKKLIPSPGIFLNNISRFLSLQLLGNHLVTRNTPHLSIW